MLFFFGVGSVLKFVSFLSTVSAQAGKIETLHGCQETKHFRREIAIIDPHSRVKKKSQSNDYKTCLFGCDEVRVTEQTITISEDDFELLTHPKGKTKKSLRILKLA